MYRNRSCYWRFTTHVRDTTTEEQPFRVVPDNALTSEGDLHLVITEAGIVATMTGTNFLVQYRKVKGTPGLIVSHVRDDANASMKKAEFLAWAWRAANDEARALGWII
jgi:riboflavin biosynthesis pyrimidine reductase